MSPPVAGLLPLLTRMTMSRLIAGFLKCYAATWRYRLGGWTTTKRLIEDDEQIVGAMYHGRHLSLWGYISRPQCKTWSIMVSHSKDGNFLSSLLHAMGWDTIRGSSGRGGARALKGGVEALQSGENPRVCLAVDGSRGPIYVPKVGVLSLASQSGAWLVCASACPDRALILRRAWDKTRVPLPWSRITVATSRPIYIPSTIRAEGLKRLLPKLELLMRRQKDVVDRHARRGKWN